MCALACRHQLEVELASQPPAPQQSWEAPARGRSGQRALLAREIESRERLTRQIAEEILARQKRLAPRDGSDQPADDPMGLPTSPANSPTPASSPAPAPSEPSSASTSPQKPKRLRFGVAGAARGRDRDEVHEADEEDEDGGGEEGGLGRHSIHVATALPRRAPPPEHRGLPLRPAAPPARLVPRSTGGSSSEALAAARSQLERTAELHAELQRREAEASLVGAAAAIGKENARAVAAIDTRLAALPPSGRAQMASKCVGRRSIL